MLKNLSIEETRNCPGKRWNKVICQQWQVSSQKDLKIATVAKLCHKKRSLISWKGHRWFTKNPEINFCREFLNKILKFYYSKSNFFLHPSGTLCCPFQLTRGGIPSKTTRNLWRVRKYQLYEEVNMELRHIRFVWGWRWGVLHIIKVSL